MGVIIFALNDSPDASENNNPFLPGSRLVVVPFGTSLANSILQKHEQVLKVGTSTNKGDNQYFVQINKNLMINTNLLKVIQLNENILMRYTVMQPA